MKPLVEFFDAFTVEEVESLAKASIANAQIWGAADCRTQYLPLLLDTRGSDMSTGTKQHSNIRSRSKNGIGARPNRRVRDAHRNLSHRPEYSLREYGVRTASAARLSAGDESSHLHAGSN
jgi:hypothetical protein